MSAETEIRQALDAIDDINLRAADLSCNEIYSGRQTAYAALREATTQTNITALLAVLDARQAKIDALQRDAERAGQLVLAVRSWDSVDAFNDDASCEIEKLSQALGDYDAAMAQSKQGGAT